MEGSWRWAPRREPEEGIPWPGGTQKESKAVGLLLVRKKRAFLLPSPGPGLPQLPLLEDFFLSALPAHLRQKKVAAFSYPPFLSQFPRMADALKSPFREAWVGNPMVLHNVPGGVPQDPKK